MRDRFLAAAEAGILLGVKYGVMLAIVAVVALAVAGDYAAVRQAAKNGQAAYNALVAMQKQAAEAAPTR